MPETWEVEEVVEVGDCAGCCDDPCEGDDGLPCTGCFDGLSVDDPGCLRIYNVPRRLIWYPYSGYPPPDVIGTLTIPMKYLGLGTWGGQAPWDYAGEAYDVRQSHYTTMHAAVFCGSGVLGFNAAILTAPGVSYVLPSWIGVPVAHADCMHCEGTTIWASWPASALVVYGHPWAITGNSWPAMVAAFEASGC